jgi:3-methyladenine DNA glycosylase AlkC
MLLKEVYSEKFLQNLVEIILQFDAEFDAKNFLKIFKDFDKQELKQRMRSISIALEKNLSSKNYQSQATVLRQVVSSLPRDKMSGLAFIIFPDFVEIFGLDDFDFSMQSLEFFTEFGSSEFAVRKFLMLDRKRALGFFKIWSKSKNHHVRRLASEGLRPRLPWGEALPFFKKDPSEILPIIENLKHDESEYVRKSVANNLNDISKDHPQVVLNLMQKWKKEKVSEGLIKHALRTLLKKGDKVALEIIDINCNNLSENSAIQSFSLQKEVVKISGDLIFDFVLENQLQNNKIRLEYVVYFLKQNGAHSKKNFQIITKNFSQGVFKFSKKHSFRDLSTRKHNAGKHVISLVVNGIEVQKLEFNLL